MYQVNLEFIAQKLQCSRDDKYECLRIIPLLAEVEETYHRGGVVGLDKLLERNPKRYAMPFLKGAIQLMMDVKTENQLVTVLYNRVVTSKWSRAQFLSSIVITETMLAIFRKEDSDYIFNFLIPSFFGMDFEENVRVVYQEYRKRKPEGTA